MCEDLIYCFLIMKNLDCLVILTLSHWINAFFYSWASSFQTKSLSEGRRVNHLLLRALGKYLWPGILTDFVAVELDLHILWCWFGCQVSHSRARPCYGREKDRWPWVVRQWRSSHPCRDSTVVAVECGTWGHVLALAVLGKWLDSIILEIFPNLNSVFQLVVSRISCVFQPAAL